MPTWSGFLALLKDNPPLAQFLGAVATAFSALVAFFAVLVSIILTNRGNNKRLQAQLSYEREMRKKERELALRKDVYLAALEAMSEGVHNVERLVELSTPLKEMTERYHEKLPSIVQVHLIAGEDTENAFIHFLSELGIAYHQLIITRTHLELQEYDVTTLEKQMISFRKEQERILELMKQSDLEDETELKRLETMREDFKREQSREAETSKEYRALRADLHTKQLAYYEECMSESGRLSQLVMLVLVAMRAELELPLDANVYVQAREPDSRRAQESMREFSESVQQIVNARYGPVEEQP